MALATLFRTKWYDYCDIQYYLNRREQLLETRMWANAQRDGRPAEHRWRAPSVRRRSLADAHYLTAVQ